MISNFCSRSAQTKLLANFTLGTLTVVGWTVGTADVAQTAMAREMETELSGESQQKRERSAAPTEGSQATETSTKDLNKPTRVWSDSKVGRLMNELEELQNERQTGQLAWGRKMRELILIGPDGLPELIAALDATPREDRLMLRSIPFLLRGIGDKRAIPALIRAVPRCYGKDGSDMGYRCEEPALFRFLQEHDSDDRDDREHYSFGRPLNEVYRTLERWTGVKNGWTQLAYIGEHHETPRQRQLKQKLFQDSALRWAQWWKQNWQKHVEDPKLSEVNLPDFDDEEPIVHRVDLSKPLRRVSSASNIIAQSFYDVESAATFYDLDTDRRAGLPQRFRECSHDELTSFRAEIIAWAKAQGFDLMGTEVEDEGTRHYVIEAIDLEAWEIPVSFWGATHSPQSMIDTGRSVEKLIAHYDADRNDYDHDQVASFFYITSEGTPGQLYLGVEVKDTNVMRGRSVGNNERNPKGLRKGRRFGLAILAESE